MKRKKFIQLNAGILAALALGKNLFDETIDPGKIKKFGIQLYTLRDVFAKDPEGILKQLASFGYKEIESYEGPQGMWWGFGARDFKKRIEDLGMKLVSSHCDAENNFEKKADEAAEAGLSYLIQASEKNGMSLKEYESFADACNYRAQVCNSRKLKFAFHNHDKSFRLQNGSCGQEILLKNTDPSVYFEMDIYWVIAAGHDPVEWLEKYPGRFKLCHIKDRSKNLVTDNGKNSTDLGKGTVDFRSVLKSAAKNGMEHYLVEQEFYPFGSSVEAAHTDAFYMKKLKI